MQNQLLYSRIKVRRVLAYPVTTTTKSIIFHMFRKYDPLCRTKPSATTLNRASMQKIPKK